MMERSINVEHLLKIEQTPRSVKKHSDRSFTNVKKFKNDDKHCKQESENKIYSIIDIKNELQIDETVKIEPEIYFKSENLSYNENTEVNSKGFSLMFDGYMDTKINTKLEPGYLVSRDMNSDVGLKESSSTTTELAYICDETINQDSSDCISEKKKKSVQKFSKKTKLNGVKTYEHSCDICGKLYKQKCHLYVHKRIHHEDQKKIYECKMCKKSFLRKDSLSRHLPLHLNEKSFSCNFCSNNFFALAHLNNHLQRVHRSDLGYDKFVCDICEKCFCSKDSLQVHLTSVHSKCRPFKCTLCRKSFTNKLYLSRHVKEHDKQYKCIKCNKLFSRKYRLQEHLIKHNNTNEYCCDTCDLRFLTGRALRSHIRCVHR